MKKVKPLGYKKSDEVIFIPHHGYYNVGICEGVVTATREAEGLVYVKAINDNGWETKRCYGRTAGKYQESPYPLRMLRHKRPGDDIKALKKRLQQGAKKCRIYDESVKEMERQIESDIREISRQMYSERIKLLPGDRNYVTRVLSRMGFPQEKRKIQ